MRQLLLLVLILGGCGTRNQDHELRVLEENGRIAGIAIPKVLVPGNEAALVVSLEGSSTPILGRIETTETELLFVPVVPLTRGLTYLVSLDSTLLGTVAVPESLAPTPELLAIYPQSDTVPENLLKVYLRFSQPMMEGRSAMFVHLLKDGRDTMRGTFLDLQPELWNEDGTVLTLWLDPGRIKLDLIPNKQLGNPLTKGSRYELRIGSGWKSKEGVALTTAARKPLYVDSRDESSPDVEQWLINAPHARSHEPLVVSFGESLDRMLLENSLVLLSAARDTIKTELRPGPGDRQVTFIPKTDWAPGDYFLVAESRLEDIAGNNLNRLFETDLSKPDQRKVARASHERKLRIQ